MPLGLFFVVVGGLGLGAGLTELVLERLDDATADDRALGQLRRLRRYAPTLIFAMAPVFMIGLLLIDARPIPDVIGGLLLASRKYHDQ